MLFPVVWSVSLSGLTTCRTFGGSFLAWAVSKHRALRDRLACSSTALKLLPQGARYVEDKKGWRMRFSEQATELQMCPRRGGGAAHHGGLGVAAAALRYPGGRRAGAARHQDRDLPPHAARLLALPALRGAAGPAGAACPVGCDLCAAWLLHMQRDLLEKFVLATCGILEEDDWVKGGRAAQVLTHAQLCSCYRKGRCKVPLHLCPAELVPHPVLTTEAFSHQPFGEGTSIQPQALQACLTATLYHCALACTGREAGEQLRGAVLAPPGRQLLAQGALVVAGHVVAEPRHGQQQQARPQPRRALALQARMVSALA